MRPEGPNMRISPRVGWGQLARFSLLDDRQYRSWHACPRARRRGGSNTVDVDACKRLSAPTRTMLGRAQERWLENVLADSRAGWNAIAQQTRSEEHTSELQSLAYLVCRLLLEKKKRISSHDAVCMRPVRPVGAYA